MYVALYMYMAGSGIPARLESLLGSLEIVLFSVEVAAAGCDPKCADSAVFRFTLELVLSSILSMVGVGCWTPALDWVGIFLYLKMRWRFERESTVLWHDALFLNLASGLLMGKISQGKE